MSMQDILLYQRTAIDVLAVFINKIGNGQWVVERNN